MRCSPAVLTQRRELQGDYPYPSPYILNGLGELPAYPVRVACDSLGAQHMAGDDLLAGLAGAVGVFYNYSGALECLDYTKVCLLRFESSLPENYMAGDDLLAGLASAVGVFHNYSGILECLDYTKARVCTQTPKFCVLRAATPSACSVGKRSVTQWCLD